MLWWPQIAEEGNRNDGDEEAGDEAARKTSLRVQFAEDVGKSPAPDAAAPVKDAVLLQARTTDDGYLTPSPTTRTTTDGVDVAYLNVVDSPTRATASFAVTSPRKRYYM